MITDVGNEPVTVLKGIGDKTAAQLEKLGLRTVGELSAFLRKLRKTDSGHLASRLRDREYLRRDHFETVPEFEERQGHGLGLGG